MSIAHEPLRYAHDEGHTDVCFSEDGEKFITCGADGDIRIWSVEEGEDPLHNCVGEWALSIRQKGDKLYVATGSNDIQILSMPEGERDGVLQRFTAPVNHIAVGKNKNLIALAAEDMEVKLINLELEPKDVTIFDKIQGPCLAVAICPNSKYLAASSGDCKLRVWNIEEKSLVKDITCFPKVNSFSNASLLCRIDFEPKMGKYLAYPVGNTVVVLNTNDWSEYTVLNCKDVSAPFSIVQWSPCGKYILSTSTEGDFVIWNVDLKNVYATSKHEKDIAICGLMWNPKGNGEIVYTDIEGQLGIMSGCISKYDIKTDTGNEVKVDDQGFMENDVDFEDVQFEDDDDADNENAVSVEKLKQQYMGSPEPELANIAEDSSHAPTPRPRTPEIPLQSPFMPSSSPEHLDPRYLCWNDVGVIRCYGNNEDDETASKSIEVEFHDVTFHNSIMVQNYHEYTMGSVSKAALAVANTSQINVIPLNASNKEWTLKVEEYEEIVLIATSENLICFATSNYMLRVSSIFGTQRAVVSIPGPTVSMAAFKNVVMVAYHAGGVRKGDQCINIKLFKLEGTSVECKEIGSALGPESTLRWVGFSELGTPGMMDSLGMLSLFPQSCNTWIPYCDTTKHLKSPADGFFVSTIFESYQAVGGIKCKGSVYPGFTPRPTICELPLEPPFAEFDTEKAQFESTLFACSTLNVQDSDRKYKETALKTFALAAKNDLDQRALEFMEILSNPQIITLGMKYASKLEKRRLVEKLMELASTLNDDNDDRIDLGRNTYSIPDQNTTKSFTRKLTLSSSKYTSRQRRKEEKSSDMSTSTNTNGNNDVTHNEDSTINTQDSLFSETVIDGTPQNSLKSGKENLEQSNDKSIKKNPFLKTKKSNQVSSNPLSLTDKFAGVEEVENKPKQSETGEKRKLSDSESEKQKEKQRKLDKFFFNRN